MLNQWWKKSPQPGQCSRTDHLSTRSWNRDRFTDTGTRERGKSLIKEFVEQVLEGSMTLARRRRSDDYGPASLKSITSSPSS